MEAVLAAVYLDGGIGSARKIIQRYILCREIEGLNSSRDYKTALQELVQRESGQVLKYRLTGEEGPDHDKRFFVEVDLNGTPVGSGKGHSKKEAEQMAAKAAIAKTLDRVFKLSRQGIKNLQNWCGAILHQFFAPGGVPEFG